MFFNQPKVTNRRCSGILQTKRQTKIYEMNYQANKLEHKPCNCNNSVYICIYTVKKLTLCNNGGHLYLQQKDEGCQSVKDFGLHQIPGTASQNFGNLAFFVTEFLGIPISRKHYNYKEI